MHVNDLRSKASVDSISVFSSFSFSDNTNTSSCNLVSSEI